MLFWKRKVFAFAVYRLSSFPLGCGWNREMLAGVWGVIYPVGEVTGSFISLRGTFKLRVFLCISHQRWKRIYLLSLFESRISFPLWTCCSSHGGTGLHPGQVADPSRIIRAWISHLNPMWDIACVTLQSKSDTEIYISVVTFTQMDSLMWPSMVRM